VAYRLKYAEALSLDKKFGQAAEAYSGVSHMNNCGDSLRKILPEKIEEASENKLTRMNIIPRSYGLKLMTETERRLQGSLSFVQ